MVMLFSCLASLSFVLGTVGYVNASPLSKAGSAAPRALTEACTQPQTCGPAPLPPCSSETDINKTLVDKMPAVAVSVFWAGRYGNETSSIRPKAEVCAGEYPGGATLGMVLCKNPHIAMPNGVGSPWPYASERFGELAHGQVRAAVGNTLYDLATFFNVELPALKLNKNVSSIVSIDAGTKNCDEICYWHCKGKCPTSLPLCIVGIVPPKPKAPEH